VLVLAWPMPMCARTTRPPNLRAACTSMPCHNCGWIHAIHAFRYSPQPASVLSPTDAAFRFYVWFAGICRVL
jgi:hypothetical protein